MAGLEQSVEELLESTAREQQQAQAAGEHGARGSTDRDDAGNKKTHQRYSEDGERDGENGKGRSRSQRERTADDGDAEMKDSDKASANGSTRSRHRSRSRDSERRARRGERFGTSGRDSRDSYRSSGDYYRGRGRGRSRSPNEERYYRPRGGRDDRRDRDRSRERGGRYDRYDRHDRDRDSRRGGRDDRRSPRPSESKKTPEPTDDERDRRTVFVQQLAARLRTKELEAFFEQVGPVKEAQIVKDRVSGRSKGVGYVEFKEEESVQKAIALTGQKLLGIPIIAQLTEAEKNRQARTADGVATQSNGIPFHRLYVGNIHFSVTEDDLKEVFGAFGELEFVQLQKEETGRSKGYGFVQYVDPANAKAALSDMNGFEIAGRPIRVGLGNDKFTPETTASLLQRFGTQQAFQGSSFSGAGGRGAHAGGSNNFDRASGRDEKGAGGASALDDSDVGGVNFSNFSRDSLMRKLARTEDPAPQAAPTATRARADPKKTAMHGPAPSRCIVVKNAYNEAEETEPNWVKDLEDDFREECHNRYGPVVHCGLFRDSNDGEIYVKFADMKGGDNALKGLNGRYFGGRTLTAQPVVDAVYNMNFPKAANL